MSHLPPALLESARSHHGLVTIDDLERGGIGRHPRSRLVRQGFLVRVHLGVYRIASHPVTFEQQALAACLADQDLVVSGTSAGRLLGLRRMPAGPVHVMSFRRRADLDDVVVHRTTVLGPGDVQRLANGTRLLRPPRLVPDLARFLDDEDLESVIEQLLDRRLANMPMLMASARRLRSSGRDGTVRLARVLDSRPAWIKPKDSGLEVRLLRGLATSGVLLEPQVELDIGDDTPIHLDGADRARRWGVEVDHVTWHGGRIASQRDKRRDRKALRMGWLVTRVTDEDLRLRFDETVDDLATIHRDRPIHEAA